MTKVSCFVINYCFVIAITFLTLCVVSTFSIQWLALSRVSSLATFPQNPRNPNSLCEKIKPSLVRQQFRFCKDHLAFMDAVKSGAIWAIEECQFQFRTRRWNCSTLNDEDITAYRMRFHTNNKKPGRILEEVVTLDNTGRISINAGRIPHNMFTNNTILMNTGNSNRLNSIYSIANHNLSISMNSINSLSTKIPPKMAQVSSRRMAMSSRATSSALVSKKHKDQALGPSTIDVNRKRRRGRKARKELERNKRKSTGMVGPYPIVPQGTREAAFVHAISSAGVAHAITRRCSSGELEDCGCDRSVKGVTENGFRWSGCSDNIAYGVSLSKKFVDARDRRMVARSKKKGGKVARALMNLHNNEAGRKLIEVNMRIECKCHGVSGSCELRTCWKAMPTFREIGEILKSKFDGATEVQQKQVGDRIELQPNHEYFKKPSEIDLVYVETSPEYCEYDIQNGSLGTKGRRCNKTSRALDGCDLLCCNRGYKTHKENVKERCSCKFHWCCYVICHTCIKEVEVHTCN